MLFAVLFSLAIGGQTPEPIPSRDCRDDNGADRCATDAQVRTRQTLGLASIEDEARSGVEAYRALYVDGYGRDMLAVAFERRPGRSPRVVVYLADGKTLSGAAPLEDWRAVREGAAYADRRLEPLPKTDELDICFHAWLTTVEMANAPQGGERVVPVRRSQQSACGGELTTRFAFDLAARAVRLLPDCAVLKSEDHRNDVTRLAVCGRLEGDGMAAASLMNQIGAGRVALRGDLAPARGWSAWMGTNNQATLTWDGVTARNERTVNGRHADRLLAAQVDAAPGLRAYMDRFNAVSSRRIETTGSLERDIGDRRETAPFQQVWVWDSGLGGWMLDTWIVEPFRPMD